MSFFGRIVATALTFIAYRRFLQRKYEEAIRYFEKALRYDIEDDVKRIASSYLARSYVVVGKYEQALEIMCEVYRIYQEQGTEKEDTLQTEEYREFLKAFSFCLSKLGHSEHARQIQKEAEAISTIH